MIDVVDRHSLSTAWVRLNETLPQERASKELREEREKKKKKNLPRKACRIYDVAAAEAVALATEDLGAYEVPLQKSFQTAKPLLGEFYQGCADDPKGDIVYGEVIFYHTRGKGTQRPTLENFHSQLRASCAGLS